MSSKVPIIIDHDLGTNPDDFFAFDLVLNDPKTNLLFAISGNGFEVERARFARKILDLYGRTNIPSFVGEKNLGVEFFCNTHIDGSEQVNYNYLESIRDILSKYSKISYLAIQGLSNLANILQQIPDANEKLDIVHMGLSMKGYEDFINGGTNMCADQLASKFVYENALSLKAVGLHTTLNDELRIRPGTKLYDRLERDDRPHAQILKTHLTEFYHRRNLWPAMHDPITASVSLGYDFVAFEPIGIEFNEQGLYRRGTKSLINVSKVNCKTQEFMALQDELF